MNDMCHHRVQVDETRIQLKMPLRGKQSITPQVARDKKGTRATFAAIWCRSKRIMKCHLDLGPRARTRRQCDILPRSREPDARNAFAFALCNRSAAVVNYLPVLRSKSIAGV